eukprot:Blabericola_migrator_1__6868@NODE_3479_length_1736_cov_25_826842_g2164_i0_p3_GENE_NODE_3479_length_1736_cov_25_826842_g2164_i0NODE_3479_length_1736_cov_25_826842_g2164_i0_p3_ORF_typecomplete_len148_score19_32RT_RNaseH/PF17917_1/5_2e29RT_RNaseH_2/PF17919_1/2_2e24_NODE_3479_length_1736_cov_25_826842_g2164_i06691112
MLPDPTKEYILDTDASKVGIGAILQQKDKDGNLHPVAYASRAFKDGERNWPPRDMEAFAVVWAVLHFSHYLLGTHFTIRTDHQSLSRHTITDHLTDELLEKLNYEDKDLEIYELAVEDGLEPITSDEEDLLQDESGTHERGYCTTHT